MGWRYKVKLQFPRSRKQIEGGLNKVGVKRRRDRPDIPIGVKLGSWTKWEGV